MLTSLGAKLNGEVLTIKQTFQKIKKCLYAVSLYIRKKNPSSVVWYHLSSIIDYVPNYQGKHRFYSNFHRYKTY